MAAVGGWEEGHGVSGDVEENRVIWERQEKGTRAMTTARRAQKFHREWRGCSMSGREKSQLIQRTSATSLEHGVHGGFDSHQESPGWI